MCQSLVKIQIGPVQDFIAAARSTRDLWSGSYLLSWLVAAGIRALPEGAELIFPNPEGQPLLKKDPSDQTDLLIPNLPNLFIAQVAGDPASAAKAVKVAIEKEWQTIAGAVWEQRAHFDLPDSAEARYHAQVARHLSLAWQATPLGGDYTAAYRLNGWHLDAVRQTRDFIAWDSVTGPGEKDSLTGKEEALIGGTDFQKKLANRGGEYAALFAKHNDHLGAVSIIKRCWHLAYLKTKCRNFPIRSIPAIAARRNTLDDNDTSGDSGGGDKYIAAIAFDGDSIGKWVGGDDLPDRTDQTDLSDHHRTFSAALSNFALKRVRAIVEPQGEWLGQLIYAGGDDVVCLVPADAALEVVAKLRAAFRNATSTIKDKHGHSPDASAGIAIGHIHAPLQDLIREAQKAEKRAKNTVGRPAFSVTLMKRSGEISHWGSQWESGGLALYQAIHEGLAVGKLSAKFPHRVCQLLEPYLIQRPDPTDPSDRSDLPGLDAANLVTREFAFAISRQSAAGTARENEVALLPLLRQYLEKISLIRPISSSLTQPLLTAVIGLCTTVAFAARNHEPQPAEKQPATA